MLLKFLMIVSGLVVAIAVVGYHPLPSGIKDPVVTHFTMGMIKIHRIILFPMRQLLQGYGSFVQDFHRAYRDLSAIRESLWDRKYASPIAHKDVKQVTKAEMAGVKVILYEPQGRVTADSNLLPGLVFFHGGGWVIGSAVIYDSIAYNYAKETGAIVVSVDYRLAPEHPFPIPVQDCLAVTRFILKHGGQYGIDVNRVGVAGDSAGANLAAAVTLKLSREKSDSPPLRFQILHYPAMQAFDLRLPSYVDYNHTSALLTAEIMSAMYAYYMGAKTDEVELFSAAIRENRHIPPTLRRSPVGDRVSTRLLPEEFQKPRHPDPQAQPSEQYEAQVYARIKDVITDEFFSPLMSEDLSGLPPTFIHVCQFDILRDDAFLYARRLQDAGVNVMVYFSQGGYHGDMLSAAIFGITSTSGDEALREAYAFMEDVLVT